MLVKHNATLRPLIRSLLYPRSPAAICWLVVPVIVDAVNRVFWCWLIAHIAIEGFKGMPPFVANRDSATTIVFVVVLVGVKAAMNHCGPNAIFRRLFTVAGLTVFKASFPRYGYSKAVARRLPPSDESSRGSYGVITAVANALPTDRLVARSWNIALADNDQLPEAHSRLYDVFGWHVSSPTRNVLARLIQGLTTLFEPFYYTNNHQREAF